MENHVENTFYLEKNEKTWIVENNDVTLHLEMIFLPNKYYFQYEKRTSNQDRNRRRQPRLFP